MVGDCTLRATLTPENTLACTESITPDRPEYPGPYEVMPAEDAQVLATSGLVMSSDVSVGGMGEAITEAVDGALATLVDGSYEGEYRNEEITKLRSGAFSGCTGLTSVNLPSVATAGVQAFSGCTGLTSVNLPSVATAGAEFMRNCSSVRHLVFPRLTAMGNWTFTGCVSLETLTLAAAVDLMSWQMLYTCPALRRIDTCDLNRFRIGLPDSTEFDTLVLRKPAMCSLSSSAAFSATKIGAGTGYIYVPRDLIEKYKVATNWATYADQFRAIEDYPDICDPDQGD